MSYITKPIIWADLETRNVIDINNALYNATCEVIMFIYAFGDGPVKVWNPLTEELPEDLSYALYEPDAYHWLWMNGRKFDTDVLRHKGLVDIAPAAQTDVGEVATCYGYPSGLAKLCVALGLPEDEAKDKRGKALIDFFCKPIHLITKRNIKKDAPYTWEQVETAQRAYAAQGEEFADPQDWPELWDMFVAYGKSDVSSMRTAHGLLPTFNETEKEHLLRVLNHQMNAQGICIDYEFVHRMAHLIPIVKEQAHSYIKARTGGIKATQVAKFLDWMKKELPGRDIPGTGKDIIERLIKEGDLKPNVSDVLNACGQSKSSSIAKYGVMDEQVHPETRRLYWYIGIRKASTTGRYGAIGGVQLHNFPRPKIKPWLINAMIEAVKSGRTPSNLLKNAPSMLRGSLVPDPDEVFTNCDLSSIEGCTLAWLSDFTQQIDDYANGVNAYFNNGPMFGLTYDQCKVYKDSEDPAEYNQYMLCKVSELSMLYMGGVSALVGMGRNYGMNMASVAQMVLDKDLMPDELLQQGVRCYNFIRLTARGRRTVDACRLTPDQWVALDAVKRAWRERHSGITRFWADIQRGLMMAWNNPGEVFNIGRNGCIGMQFDNNMFGIQLPSGRVLTYLDGRISETSTAKKKTDEEIAKMTDAQLMEYDEDSADDRPVLVYTAFDNTGNPYKRPQIAHAGVVCNNVNQATAASVLDEGIIAAWREGWKVRAHIHDQLLTSNKRGDPRFTPTKLEQLMSRPLSWAPGLPLKAKGEYLERFAK